MSIIRAPATLKGLRAHPCDPLILAVRMDGRPLTGLTAEIDWRIGGALARLVDSGRFATDSPVLQPAHPLVPSGRLVIWRVGAATVNDIARQVDGLKGDRLGICPEDFEFTDAEVERAFNGEVVLFRRPEK